jgi:hypothetical protein
MHRERVRCHRGAAFVSGQPLGNYSAVDDKEKDRSEFMKTLLAQVAKDTEHYAAFGRFVASYALAESMVHYVTRVFSGLEDKPARIVFSGMRLGDLTERLRKLTRPKPAIYKEIDDCLTRLGIIAKERHKLIHRTVSLKDGRGPGFTVSNEMTVASLLNAEEEIVDIDTLASMQWDCLVVAFRLLLVRGSLKKRRRISETEQHTFAWRYKPPQPSPKRPKRPETHRSRKRQRPSYPG